MPNKLSQTGQIDEVYLIPSYQDSEDPKNPSGVESRRFMAIRPQWWATLCGSWGAKTKLANASACPWSKLNTAMGISGGLARLEC